MKLGQGSPHSTPKRIRNVNRASGKRPNGVMTIPEGGGFPRGCEKTWLTSVLSGERAASRTTRTFTLAH